MVSAKRGDARREAILAAAEKVFTSEGFGVSISRIAQAAATSKETLYRFFGNKDGLIAAVMARGLAERMERLEVSTDAPAERVVTELARGYQELAFEPEFLRAYRFLLGAVDRNPELGRAFNRLVTDVVVARVEFVFAELMNRGDLPERPTGPTANAFLGMLQGKTLNKALAGEHDARELLALRSEAVAWVLGDAHLAPAKKSRRSQRKRV